MLAVFLLGQSVLSGILVSKSVLRKEDMKFLQAHLSYLGAGKLIRTPLRPFEPLSCSSTLSHPLPFGRSQVSEITLVKTSFRIKNEFNSCVQISEVVVANEVRHCRSIYGLRAGKSSPVVFRLGPTQPWQVP